MNRKYGLLLLLTLAVTGCRFAKVPVTSSETGPVSVTPAPNLFPISGWVRRTNADNSFSIAIPQELETDSVTGSIANVTANNGDASHLVIVTAGYYYSGRRELHIPSDVVASETILDDLIWNVGPLTSPERYYQYDNHRGQDAILAGVLHGLDVQIHIRCFVDDLLVYYWQISVPIADIRLQQPTVDAYLASFKLTGN